MELTFKILELAKELEVRYQEFIQGEKEILDVKGNPFYLKLVSQELGNIGFEGLSIKKDQINKMMKMKKDFLENKVTLNDFKKMLVTSLEKNETTNVSEYLLRLYSIVKKESEIKNGFAIDKQTASILSTYLNKFYNLFLESLSYEDYFLKDNAIIDDLVEDYQLDKIEYNELMNGINDFYIDWKPLHKIHTR